MEGGTEPDGWRAYAIDDIADVVGGSTPSTREPANFDGDVPWLTPKDLSGPHDWYMARGERNLSQQGLDSCSAKLLPVGSVLLSTRAPIGYVALAKNPIATNQGFRTSSRGKASWRSTCTPPCRSSSQRRRWLTRSEHMPYPATSASGASPPRPARWPLNATHCCRSWSRGRCEWGTIELVDVTIRVPALEKLMDYAASGIGSVAGPMLAGWRADKESEAKRITAHGDADVMSILAEGQAGAMSIIAEAQADARQHLSSPEIAVAGELTIGEAIEQRVRFQEEKRQRNIAAIVSQAATQLGDGEVEDHEPDHDWTARFFNEAQDVSSEDMQILWAKVLAGEVERPGSTSQHTLGVLKVLDRSTAQLFTKVCSMCIRIPVQGDENGIVILPSVGRKIGSNELNDFGILYFHMTILRDYGLLTHSDTSSLTVSFGFESAGVNRGTPTAFFHQESAWILVRKGDQDADNTFELEGVFLSKPGRELCRAITIESVDEYTAELKSFFERNRLTMTGLGRFELR